MGVLGKAVLDLLHEGGAGTAQLIDADLERLDRRRIIPVPHQFGKHGVSGADLLPGVLFAAHQGGQFRVLDRGPGARGDQGLLDQAAAGHVGQAESFGCRLFPLGGAGLVPAHPGEDTDVGFKNETDPRFQNLLGTVRLGGSARPVEENRHGLGKSRQRLVGPSQGTPRHAQKGQLLGGFRMLVAQLLPGKGVNTDQEVLRLPWPSVHDQGHGVAEAADFQLVHHPIGASPRILEVPQCARPVPLGSQ